MKEHMRQPVEPFNERLLAVSQEIVGQAVTRLEDELQFGEAAREHLIESASYGYWFSLRGSRRVDGDIAGSDGMSFFTVRPPEALGYVEAPSPRGVPALLADIRLYYGKTTPGNKYTVFAAPDMPAVMISGRDQEETDLYRKHCDTFRMVGAMQEMHPHAVHVLEPAEEQTLLAALLAVAQDVDVRDGLEELLGKPELGLPREAERRIANYILRSPDIIMNEATRDNVQLFAK